jgi:hypothetical protein
MSDESGIVHPVFLHPGPVDKVACITGSNE